MQFKTFMLPASGSEQTEENLNVFLRTHRIVSVRSEFVSGETPAWCILVEYVQQNESDSKSSGKVDYMKILSPDEFALFSKLRNLRKELAAKDGVPPFVVFTDEQLASIIKQNPTDLGKLSAIQGIGQTKAEKYGNAVLKAIQEQNEAGKQPV
ncbi:MAG: HRDC domain-containing protein [Treponema sp.]|nr:HRDC domain-containing protein [Treponema sp.]